MKITSKILSLPPYISTAWKNIISLHVDVQSGALILIVTLHNGTQIQVPHLEKNLIQTIFAMHAKHVELEQNLSPSSSATSIAHSLPLNPDTLLNFTLPFGDNLNGIHNALQHDPDQMDAPDLPPELLRQVSLFPNTLGIKDLNILPKAEPHCNCTHCQIAKALHSGHTTSENTDDEEIVSDQDLQFRTWNIKPVADKLFIVQNPFDEQEQYQVYLGETLGCTCGKKRCEHIHAVLSESI